MIISGEYISVFVMIRKVNIESDLKSDSLTNNSNANGAWLVGYFKPNGSFYAVHETKDMPTAAKFINFLNGANVKIS